MAREETKIGLCAVLLVCALSLPVHAAKWTAHAPVAGEVTGIGAASDKDAYGAGGSNGAGAGAIITSDGGSTFDFTPVSGSFVLLDCAASETAQVFNGLFGAHYSSDGGKTFAASTGGGGQGQSVEKFGDSSFGITGAFGGTGVAISNDGGKSFQHMSASSALDENHPARYGAFPTQDTWYISAGAWPTHQSSEDEDSESELVKQISEMYQVRKSSSTGRAFVTKRRPTTSGANNITQYTAALAKTTDGGKTWTNIFQQDGHFYFNGIHCISEKHCIAVAEGHNVSPPGARIFVTRDGGKTFNQTLFSQGRDSSLMGIRMVSDQEAWAVGTNAVNGQMEASFYHTMDGGLTWNNNPVKGIGALGIDCADAEHCFAAAITATDQGTIAIYA